jgi:predicted RecB family nuclease
MLALISTSRVRNTKQRKRKSILDKVALDARRERRHNAALDKLEALYAEKRINRERSKLSTEKSKPEFIYIEPNKNVVIDEIEEAYSVIVDQVGSNIGFTEGHVLAEMMKSLMD